jgi:chromosome partitioning protein
MIVSICNFKGGVAKTSSTVNIGAGLARKGQRVLLVDMDPQYNLTTSLGIPEVEQSVYESLMKKEALPIHHITDNLDLIPSSIELNKAQIELASEFKREGRLMDLLSPIQDQVYMRNFAL